jgi:hypothetical protein
MGGTLRTGKEAAGISGPEKVNRALARKVAAPRLTNYRGSF